MVEAALREINETLQNIDKHFNPPKRTDWRMMIIYLVTGGMTIGVMYLLYKMLQPLYNYNF